MVSVFLSRLVVIIAGTLYPAYKSYKAVRTKDVREYVKWMMYWIVFALFCVVETFADIFISFWLPFYYELKILFVLWLLSPWTKGASILYRKWVHPTLSQHEKEIDAMLEQAKSESYNQVLRLGSRGLLCAREIIATAALRGQAQLVQQLQRSYSTSDIPASIPPRKAHEPEIQEVDDEGHPIEESELTEESYENEEIDNPEDGSSEQIEPRRSKRSRRPRTTDIPSDSMYNTLPRRTVRHHK